MLALQRQRLLQYAALFSPCRRLVRVLRLDLREVQNESRDKQPEVESYTPLDNS